MGGVCKNEIFRGKKDMKTAENGLYIEQESILPAMGLCLSVPASVPVTGAVFSGNGSAFLNLEYMRVEEGISSYRIVEESRELLESIYITVYGLLEKVCCMLCNVMREYSRRMLFFQVEKSPCVLRL